MNGPEIGALSDALCDAFDLRTFDRMLLTRLGRRRDAIAADGPMSAVSFETITAAVREGWERALIREAVEYVPNNSRLRQFCLDHPHIAPPVPLLLAEFAPHDQLPPQTDPPPMPPAGPSAGDRAWWRLFTLRRLVVVVAIFALGWVIYSVLIKSKPPGPENTMEKDVKKTFDELYAKGAKGSDALRLGLWLDDSLTQSDLREIEVLTNALHDGNAHVVKVGVVDGNLRSWIGHSRFTRDGTPDPTTMLNDQTIQAIVFVGLFRTPAGTGKSPVGPVAAALSKKKDCFVVLSTEDKVSWHAYLGQNTPKEIKDELDKDKKDKKVDRMLYASIRGHSLYEHNFGAFFEAVRKRQPGLPGWYENLR